MKKLYSLLFSLMLLQATNAQTITKMSMNELLKMADTTTQPLVINFWATWCAPCIKEIPWFEKTVAKYKTQHVKLILVSLDFEEDYPKAIAGFAKQKGYQSSIIWLNETNPEEFCAKVDKSWKGTIPVSLFINNKKHYRSFLNQQLPEERLKLEIEKMLQ